MNKIKKTKKVKKIVKKDEYIFLSIWDKNSQNIRYSSEKQFKKLEWRKFADIREKRKLYYVDFMYISLAQFHVCRTLYNPIQKEKWTLNVYKEHSRFCQWLKWKCDNLQEIQERQNLAYNIFKNGSIRYNPRSRLSEEKNEKKDTLNFSWLSSLQYSGSWHTKVSLSDIFARNWSK